MIVIFLRVSLALIALIGILGLAEAVAQAIGGNRAMAGWALFDAWVAGACGLSAWTLPAPKDGGGP